MNTRTEITTTTENAVFGWLDGEEFIELNEETKSELLKRKDFRERLLEAIEFCFENLKDAVVEDLKDIWMRLDRIEQ